MASAQAQHPEKKPKGSGSIESFQFDLGVAKEQRAEIDRELTLLENRISSILDRCEVHGMKVLPALFQLTQDKKDLELIANSLLRVAPLLEKKKELEKKQGVFDLAESNPLFFKAAFGDLSGEFSDLAEADVMNEETSEEEATPGQTKPTPRPHTDFEEL